MANQTNQTTTQTAEQSTSNDPNVNVSSSTNYDELLKTNPAFANWVQNQSKAAAESAVTEASRKWKVKYDNSMSEAERLREMTAEERASYYQKKYEDSQAEQQRKENAQTLKAETRNQFSEAGIPDDLLPLFKFEEETAENLKSQIGILSKYEFYPKGTLEQKVREALNKKLQQSSPHSSGRTSGSDDLTARAQEALNNGNRLEYIKLMRENALKVK